MDFMATKSSKLNFCGSIAKMKIFWYNAPHFLKGSEIYEEF